MNSVNPIIFTVQSSHLKGPKVIENTFLHIKYKKYLVFVCKKVSLDFDEKPSTILHNNTMIIPFYNQMVSCFQTVKKTSRNQI